MNIEDLELCGAKILSFEVKNDSRGSFSRHYCCETLESVGLPSHWPQGNISTNTHPHTMRGIHFQKFPYEEPKIVRCCNGSMVDVIVDLQKESPTYLKHQCIELNENDGKAVFVPAGFGHAFITLQENTKVLYLMGEKHNQSASFGIRWNDESIGIDWPVEPKHISKQDQSWPDFIPN